MDINSVVRFFRPVRSTFRQRKALGQDFHITNDIAFTWDQIHTAIGRAFEVKVRNVHVPTDTLIRYNPEWTGPLVGDNMWTALFDNSKIKNAVGEFTCSADLNEILAEPAAFAQRNLKLSGQSEKPDKLMLGDLLVDRIIEDQLSLRTG